MRSLNGAIILGVLLVIVLPQQNTVALSLPTSDSTHYFGQNFIGGPDDWIRIEFAVYDNGGQELIDAGYELPWDEAAEFVYAYQVINEVTSIDRTIDFFSIYGIGKDAIVSVGDIGSADDSPLSLPDRGQEPVFDAMVLDENEEDEDGAYFSSAYWQFGTNALILGEHSFFLLITSDHDYKSGTYNFEAPQSSSIAVPNPEPGTMALFGLGSVLLFKKRRKKQKP